jgi:hypothetical protein
MAGESQFGLDTEQAIAIAGACASKWTATQSGLLMLPAALMTAFMMPLIGKMLEKGVPVTFSTDMDYWNDRMKKPNGELLSSSL